MGGESEGALCGLDGDEADGAGVCVDATVDEHDSLGAGDVFGQFGGPLMAGQRLNFRVLAKALLGPAGKTKPDAVIAAQRISAGKDQASGWIGWHEFIRFYPSPDKLVDHLAFCGE